MRNQAIQQHVLRSPRQARMRLGYARVPTDGQSFESQCQRLSAAKCEKLVEHPRRGDVLVVTRLDRLARSTTKLLRIAERITEKRAGLQSFDEPWAGTTSPSGRMVMTIFAGIAEFERSFILSRT